MLLRVAARPLLLIDVDGVIALFDLQRARRPAAGQLAPD